MTIQGQTEKWNPISKLSHWHRIQSAITRGVPVPDIGKADCPGRSIYSVIITYRNDVCNKFHKNDSSRMTKKLLSITL